MSLDSDYGKTGSVHLYDESAKNKVSHLLLKGDVLVGFLQLNPDSGNWIINQQQVDAHVKRLRKMLASCSSIFSWIRLGIAVSAASSAKPLDNLRVGLGSHIWTASFGHTKGFSKTCLVLRMESRRM